MGWKENLEELRAVGWQPPPPQPPSASPEDDKLVVAEELPPLPDFPYTDDPYEIKRQMDVRLHMLAQQFFKLAHAGDKMASREYDRLERARRDLNGLDAPKEVNIAMSRHPDDLESLTNAELEAIVRQYRDSLAIEGECATVPQALPTVP